MYKNIPKSDISIRAFNVYKEWNFDETNIELIFGKKFTTPFDYSDEKSGIFYKRSVYDSIYSQYYKDSTSASFFSGGRRINTTSENERNMGDEIAVISIPHKYIGNGIKPGTVTVSDPDLNITLTDDSYSNLVSGSDVYGNIFYENGLIVITRDVVSGSNWNRYELIYNSTKTIYENEIFIPIGMGEFNVSTNPSAIVELGGETSIVTVTDPKDITKTTTYKYHNTGDRYIKNKITLDNGTEYDFRISSSIMPDFRGGFSDYMTSRDNDPTGSYLAPYITTIGLYDDETNLVAVAKLPQPIKSLPDYPINFLIRFDT